MFMYYPVIGKYTNLRVVWNRIDTFIWDLIYGSLITDNIYDNILCKQSMGATMFT